MPPTISPLDGRYGPRVGHLAACFSEEALMGARCAVELRYLLALDEVGVFAPLTAAERGRVEATLEAGLSPEGVSRIRAIEAETNHDVKACERYLAEHLALAEPNRVHFGLTSEDVNNLAWTLLLERYRTEHQVPALRTLLVRLTDLAEAWAAAPFPARTHGQPASPTTAGKEMAVFVSRLLRQYEGVTSFRFTGKLAGATGTYAAFMAAAPEVDWPRFAARFVRSLGLEPAPIVTQVEDHDTWCDYFDRVRRINNIVADLDVDGWLYISYGAFRLRRKPGEVGSSTMPHKVNPIRFENSEGNISVANTLLAMLSDRLPRSRMQRDLSDSTVERNMGVALAHSHLAWTETEKGLARLELDSERCLEQLRSTPEVLAEAVQTVLRRHGAKEPFERVAAWSRAGSPSREAYEAFVGSLDLPPEVRKALGSLAVEDYTGAAERLCREVVARAREVLR